MPPATAPRPARPRRARDRRHGLALVLSGVLLLGPALAGCDVRWETPPPSPLVPDATEQARQRAAEQAAELSELAGAAVTGAPEAEAAVLTRVVEVAAEHLVALGGVHDPGPSASAGPSATPTPSGTATVPPAVTTADVLALLGESAASAREDASAVPDGPLGRLLASVATARLLLGDALSAAAALPVDAAEPLEVPAEVPTGVTDRDLVLLTASEDAAGFAWEVAAARSQGDARTTAAARAAQHRARAAAWAVLAGVSGTGTDPRRSAYDLPEALRVPSPAADVAAALAALEDGLAGSYSTLVASAEPGSRDAVVDALVDAARAAAGLRGATSPVPALPGMASPAPTEG